MNLQVKINENAQTKYPALKIAFVFLSSVPKYQSDKEKEDAQDKIVHETITKFKDTKTVRGHYLNEQYKAFYRSMGLKPKKVSTPIKQVERVLKTNSYRSIFKTIDMCMLIEYTTLVSFQVYDPDKITGNLVIKIATGEEEITDFHKQVKQCKKGELLLVDDDSTLHSVYYGNNVNKSIDNDSTRHLVRIMGIPGISENDFNMALELFLAADKHSSSIVLSSQNPIQTLLSSKD